MSRIYGYARISRAQQSIDRQIRNIKNMYPQAIILQEAYTGTKIDRPEWNKLFNRVQAGDTIVFDSVSRMSRNADDKRTRVFLNNVICITKKRATE